MTAKTTYRAIPSVQELLQSPDLQAFNIHPRYLKEIIREEIAVLRASIAKGKSNSEAVIPQTLRRNILARLEKLSQPGLKRVVNATGIILHTNMGRAPLAKPALQAIADFAENYTNLEIDLSSGRRGKRHQHCGGIAVLDNRRRSSAGS